MTYTYPTPTTIDTFYTNSEGYLVTPEKLIYGEGYKLVEVQAPYGYVLDSTPIEFDITQEHSTKENALTIVKVERPNIAQKGVIEITKEGEIFSSVCMLGGGYIDENGNEVTFPITYSPIYENGNLANAVFQIYAAEDITTLDGTVRYQQGELVDEITTSDNGIAKSKLLYLGKYTVIEKTAPDRFINANEQYDIELTYAGQNVSVTSTALSVYNERQKVFVSLLKELSQDEKFKLGMNNEILSVQFGIFADENITAADGTVIPKDALITYNGLKSKYLNTIAFYQVGDFYETFDEDAKTVAKHLDLVITSRHINDTDRTAMCGFPKHSLERYVKNLNAFGFSVVALSLENDVRKENLYPYPPLDNDYKIKRAKELINDFVNKEYERTDGADFSDLSNVNVAYTNLGDNEGHEVQASVDLVDFAVNKYYDGKLAEHSEYKSLDELIEFELEGLSYDDLVYISEDKIAELEKDNKISAPKSQPKSRVQTFDLHPEIPMSARHNYNFAEKEIETVGKKERFRRNIEAINVLRDCELENRFATPEEQEILSGYVGWGGLSEAFDENNDAWANEFIELYTVLSPDEYKVARASTLTAFYTPQPVISAIYKSLDNLGFKQGNILEPCCAIGNFIGMLPENMQDSKMFGIEIDTVSAGIAQQLYQKSSIMAQPFEKANLPDSFFDAVVGNVPFGDYKLNDKRYDKNNFLIHDYFFAKSLDKLRPGGVMCLVTSKGTMDKESSNVRRYLAQRADLLGAIRLPDNTFQHY